MRLWASSVAQAAAGIGLVGSAGLHGLADGRELFGGAEAGVDVAALLELLEGLPVGIEALGLHIGTVVAADADPRPSRDRATSWRG